MKHIRKISEYGIVGGIGVCVLLAITGCETQNKNEVVVQKAQENVFVIIEEQEDGSYKILEEYPSDTTRVLLKAKDGSERLLSQEEIDEMLKAEEQNIDNGTSELVNPSGAGLTLGQAILASAAGAIIGSWIGSKLFNNQNYQAKQRTTYKTPQAYERSKNSLNNAKGSAAKSASSGAKSGFFGGGSSSSQRAVGA